MHSTSVKTRISSLSACVKYATQCGATEGRQAYFFYGWRGYVSGGKLRVTNFYEESLRWDFGTEEINDCCLVFYKTDRCYLLSAYTHCLETFVSEITLGAELEVSENLTQGDYDNEIVYYYQHVDLDDPKFKKAVIVYRPYDFPATVKGNGFVIEWEARGVLSKVTIIDGVDENFVMKELKKAVRCWTQHLRIEIFIPF
jgi:hypothetical protein